MIDGMAVDIVFCKDADYDSNEVLNKASTMRIHIPGH